jgi:hypothetical protein
VLDADDAGRGSAVCLHGSNPEPLVSTFAKGAQTSHFRSQFLDLDQIQICRSQTILAIYVKGQFLQPKEISVLTAF